MHAHIRNMSANTHQLLTHQKRLRHAHSFNHNIKAILVREELARDLTSLLRVIDLVHLCRTDFLRGIKTKLIAVEEHDRARRVQPRADCGCESYGSGTDNGDGAAGFDVSTQHADFEARGQDVAVDEERAFVCAFGDRVQTAVREGHEDVLGLCAVFGVAELPAAVFACVVEAVKSTLAIRLTIQKVKSQKVFQMRILGHKY